MSCYEPLKGFVTGINKNNKPMLKLLSYDYKWIDLKGIAYTTPVPYGDKDVLTSDYFLLPCGHCLGCREDQSREWATRLIMEMEDHDSSYFITLTYNDENIKNVFYYDDDTGEVDWNYTLDKRDIQLFMKDLRYHFSNDKIRYYICGEYGENTNRPHYHGILFGLHLDDLVFAGRSETGNNYFTSKSIENIWKKGFVSVEKANYATCKYTASYVTKKIGIRSNDYYKKLGIIPPFSLSSRKPGIGYNWFVKNLDKCFDINDIRIPMIDGSYQIRLPRYFKKKMEDVDPERYEHFKKKRMLAAIDQQELVLEKTNLDLISYLEVKRKNHESRIKKRNKI